MSIKISAGLVIIQDNQILLVHPTGSPWKKTYSIPKGHLEKGEDILDAAIRETKEETGVKIKKSEILQPEGTLHIDYKNEKGKVYKRVYYWIVFPQRNISKKFKPQLKEVDWVGFVDKIEAKQRIFGRFKPLLKYLK